MSDPKINATTDLSPDPANEQPQAESGEATSPTRFGDWEKNGRCIDF